MRENKNPKTIKNHRNGLHKRVFEEKSNVRVIGNDQKYILHPRKSPPTQLQKIGSALFYAVCSICIVFVNKSVLTIYHFPSAQILGNSLTMGKYSLIPSTSDFLEENQSGWSEYDCRSRLSGGHLRPKRSNWKRHGSNDSSSSNSWNAQSNWKGWFSRFFKRYSKKSFSTSNFIFVQYGVRLNVYTGKLTELMSRIIWVILYLWLI